jgi:hypothetical protein
VIAVGDSKQIEDDGYLQLDEASLGAPTLVPISLTSSNANLGNKLK